MRCRRASSSSSCCRVGLAVGVDMGRNIFQSEAPVAMIQAVRKVVHERLKPQHAYDYFQTLRLEAKAEVFTK